LIALRAGSECSVQISSALAAAAATADFNANLVSDDGPSRVTRSVQTLPRSAHASRMSSAYHAGAGGSLTRPVSTPRPTAVVDKQVRSLLKTVRSRFSSTSFYFDEFRGI